MSRLPRRAMILAAGLGTRMRPLSLDLPKPLMPLWNRSLLARHVDLLSAWGVNEILLNVHWEAEQVIREAMTLSCADCRISISHEPDILGTGGALRKAAWFFDDHPFWLLNADVVVANLDRYPIWRALCADPQVLAACWVEPVRGPRTVRVTRGRITDFAVARPGADATFTFCGVQCVRPDLLHWIPQQTGFSSLIDAYRLAQRRGRIIAGVTVPGSYWADAGTPERYLDVHSETAQFFAPDTTANVCVAATARVGAAAVLRNCVVWDDAEIAPGTTAENAVIGRGSFVSGAVSGLALPARHVLEESERQAVDRIAPQPHEKLTAILLPARGSNRSYVRLQTSHWSAMLMRYDVARKENRLFCGIARALRRARWPVPQIWADSSEDNWALMEDVGDESLGARCAQAPARIGSDYTLVLDRLLQLHGRVTRLFRRRPPCTLPAFNESVYRYERQLFTQQYLARYPQLTQAEQHRMRNELKRAIRPLLQLQPVYIHRDLQSSNIHWHHGGPVFIDFQGMRLGAAAYDLASLLMDPYVELPDSVRDDLLADYARRANPATFSIPAYRIACVQRLCQALGAYARLAKLPGCERFERHIPVAEQRLRNALAMMDGFPNLNRFLIG